MKKVTFILILIFSFLIGTSQSCLPEGITFETQAQIDSFQINYPNCTEIEGDVMIGESYFSSDIVNLNGLSVVTSIGGDLFIGGNDVLTSLTGLDNVTSIGEYLDIENNDVLTSLTGLDNVTSIGGYLSIGYNDALTSLTGLDNVTSIGGDLEIKRNNLLTNLVGLDSLTFIGGNLWFYGNDSLVTLTGLENLTSIGGFLGLGAEDQGGNVGNPVLFSLSALAGLSFVGDAIYITGNNALVSLAGLEGVTSIDGRLAIFDNLALASLTGLQGITSIGGDLYIADNDALTSLEGLDNIDAASIDGLSIKQNDVLSTCEVLSVCDYLKNPSGWVSINNNAIGCDSQQEVEDACESVSVNEQTFDAGLSLSPNPASHELNISSGEYNIDELTIYTITGQRVMQERPVNGNVDISHLQPGMYIVEVTVENRKIRRKLLVE